MVIYLTRHGQTVLNKKKLMQGRSDVPLNEKGKAQARVLGRNLKDIHFDAIYASPLDRAIETAAIAADTDRSSIITDERLLETDFGVYEKKPYGKLGLKMSLYWAFPEIFKAPPTVETVESMVNRSSDFIFELLDKDYENVLIVCHGGIIRALSGVLEGRKNGIKWRPKPKNCELRIYSSGND